MTATHWTLAQTLQRQGITPHALIKATGLSKGTVYDIVNGKSQAITLETVDRLLDGLEQLTGQRMPLDAVLGRTEPEDPYAHLFVDAKPYDPEEARRHLAPWNAEEQEADEQYWAALAHEQQERRERPDKTMQELSEIFGESSGDMERPA